jgi:hypothetical protein
MSSSPTASQPERNAPNPPGGRVGTITVGWEGNEAPGRATTNSGNNTHHAQNAPTETPYALNIPQGTHYAQIISNETHHAQNISNGTHYAQNIATSTQAPSSNSRCTLGSSTGALANPLTQPQPTTTTPSSSPATGNTLPFSRRQSRLPQHRPTYTALHQNVRYHTGDRDLDLRHLQRDMLEVERQTMENPYEWSTALRHHRRL